MGDEARLSQTIDMWERDCDRKIAPLRATADRLIGANLLEQGMTLDGFVRGVEWAVESLHLRMTTGEGPDMAEGGEA